MNLNSVALDKIVGLTDGFTGAELRAVCTEAGFCAIRENRNHVTETDFLSAVEKVRLEAEEDADEQFFG